MIWLFLAVASRNVTGLLFAATRGGVGECVAPRPSRVNAQRSDDGLGLERDKLHGRLVDRRSVVEMAPSVVMIRPSTDERGAQTRVASARVGVLPKAGGGRATRTRACAITTPDVAFASCIVARDPRSRIVSRR